MKKTSHNMPQQLHLEMVLKVLDQKIQYLEVITGYPASQQSKHFDSDSVETFFKSVAIALYTESCCVIINHLHNKQAVRFVDLSTISDWNDIINSDEYKSVKNIRDQFAGHQDLGNNNNSYPLSRSVGEIDVQRIVELRKLFEEIVKKFELIGAKNKQTYAKTALRDPAAKTAAEMVLRCAAPKTTDATII